MSQNFSFRQAAVIGAGTMGRGIVMCLANAGLDVQWLDSNPQMLNQALGAVADTYAHNVRQGRIGEEEAAARRARITPVQHLAAMREADLV
ncbi:3-hydroxyacyl-CoA dehydrogenase NAD-binding domain-containing protein, partial [Pseudomonas aeruginosa]